MSESLDRYRGAEYRRLFAAARRSLERTGGQLTGRIGITDPDDAERKAIIGVTGVHQAAGTKRMTVHLAELDAALSRATGLGLPAVLAAFGQPLRDRPAETALLAATRTALIAAAEASALNESSPWYRTWLADLGRDGTVTRLANTADSTALGQAVRALEYLAARPANTAPIALPALAAHITGDTKALNHGTTLATLIMRALVLREGVARPASAAQRRELWDLSDVIVDDLASRVLVLNLTAHGDGLAEWLTGAARYGTPFQVTLQQLASHRIRLDPARMFVCENPAVLRRACAELGPACPPLICTEGQPSTAFHKLARTAVAAGGELAYHGDFDWPGVAIAAKVIDRHGARPWRMTAGDYLSGVNATDTSVVLRGEPVPTPWETGLCETMRATGRAIYEEAVAGQLLTDLRDASGLLEDAEDGLPHLGSVDGAADRVQLGGSQGRADRARGQHVRRIDHRVAAVDQRQEPAAGVGGEGDPQRLRVDPASLEDDGGPVRGRCTGAQAHAGEVAVWRVLEFIGVV